MRDSLYILTKYWRKHKKNLIALLFSGVLLCAVVCCAFLMLRQSFARHLNRLYDNTGAYTYMINSRYQGEISHLSDDNTISGTVYCYGKTGAYGKRYTYGSLDDPHGLAHIPVESGRLPEREGEIAIDKNVLGKLGFFGSAGDEISLDTGTYTLVGIIGDAYGKNRQYSEITQELLQDELYYNDSHSDIPEPFPMMFIAPGHEDKAVYSYTMLDNAMPFSHDDIAALCSDDDRTLFPEDLLGNIVVNDKAHSADIGIFDHGFYKDLYHLYLISGVASVVALLSVIAVLRNIFAEREGSIAMLRRIGVSKRGIRIMYATECVILCIIQTAIGLALGCAAHLCIYKFQISFLGMSRYSGFTSDDNVLRNTVSPFITAAMFSFAAMLCGYVFSVCISHLKAVRRRRKKAGTLRSCISKAFATRAVTVIQTISLALICFGAVIGYMIYLEYGWYYNEDTGEYIDPVSTHFGDSDRFDFSEDSIAEYYTVQPPETVRVGSFTFARYTQASFGIDDSTAASLDGSVSTGALAQTFIVGDETNGLMHAITFGSEEEKSFFCEYSSEQGKALINSDSTLYKCPTKLADIHTIEGLSGYVIQGRIDPDKISGGDEIILVVNTDRIPLSVGENITVGSAATTNGFGIDKLGMSDVTVGAVIALPKDIDRISRYAVFAGDDYSLLTTASGAKALGMHNASYTEVFAKQTLPTGAIPMGTGMTMTSYEHRRHEIAISSLTKYGSVGLLIIVMSMLGFAAYFNGIGMKIRLKEYQISAMRAVGTPLKKLRRRLILDAVRIPITASVIALGGIKLMQRLTLSADRWYQSIKQSIYEIPQSMEGNWQLINEYMDSQMKWDRQYVASHFINDKLWHIPVIVPLIVILLLICAVSVLLTRKSFKQFTPDIAGSLARGRKRR